MLSENSFKEHMEVVDSTGAHVGTVDHVEGGRIKLTRTDSTDGRHHYLDTSAVDRIEDGKAVLKGGKADLGEAEIAAASEYHARSDTPLAGVEDRPLFGTSGTGTGMGGSGAGEH